MATDVVEVDKITNIIEVVESTIQLVSDTTTSVITETNSLIQVVETTTSNEVTSTENTINIVEVALTSSVIDSAEKIIEVISETIPVLYGDEEVAYARRIDFISESVLYKGEAAPGTLDTAPGWRIRKITIGLDGDVNEQWALGNSLFNKVWANRESLEYI